MIGALGTIVLSMNLRPEFVAQVQDADEFVLREAEHAGRLQVCTLLLQHVDQLHLLLECGHELVPLPLYLPVLCEEAV
eukprot:CAMPEP_0179007074 /NCGR_PEP_ID=MMETSP0795-20121207/14939_1 /TAXON_ID=88552 /ORGANISM="Amoebophrya sp., Strain Ameob2" /LENGTH=77 /DNA_ID=CAMNT_0020701969 /DNA_START=31 /DNA_END=264 /DNA_ORIENTATION=+